MIVEETMKNNIWHGCKALCLSLSGTIVSACEVTIKYRYHIFTRLTTQMWTHSGLLMYICIRPTVVISGTDNGSSLSHFQNITCTKAHLSSIGALVTNSSEISIKIHSFHTRKLIWKCCPQTNHHFVHALTCKYYFWSTIVGVNLLNCHFIDMCATAAVQKKLCFQSVFANIAFCQCMYKSIHLTGFIRFIDVGLLKKMTATTSTWYSQVRL